MLNIIIFGAPGSGKGTQSEFIIKKYDLLHISSGEILREEIEKQTALGLIAKKYISKGHLVPDQLIIDIISSVLDRNPQAKGYILDGFPRTLSQGEHLDLMLRDKGTAIAAVFNLVVDEEELTRRLLLRGKEFGRADDNIETIQERLLVYRNQTEPLNEYYKKKGKLFKIKGGSSAEDVFENIAEVIDRLSF